MLCVEKLHPLIAYILAFGLPILGATTVYCTFLSKYVESKIESFIAQLTTVILVFMSLGLCMALSSKVLNEVILACNRGQFGFKTTSTALGALALFFILKVYLQRDFLANSKLNLFAISFDLFSIFLFLLSLPFVDFVSR